MRDKCRQCEDTGFAIGQDGRVQSCPLCGNSTASDVKEIAEYLREAAYHKAAMWDALRQLEEITGFEVESDNTVVDSLAADCGVPATYPTVDDTTVQEFLKGLLDALSD